MSNPTQEELLNESYWDNFEYDAKREVKKPKRRLAAGLAGAALKGAYKGAKGLAKIAMPNSAHHFSGLKQNVKDIASDLKNTYKTSRDFFTPRKERYKKIFLNNGYEMLDEPPKASGANFLVRAKKIIDFNPDTGEHILSDEPNTFLVDKEGRVRNTKYTRSFAKNDSDYGGI